MRAAVSNGRPYRDPGRGSDNMPGNSSEGIGVFSGNLNFYNRRRPHSSLDSSTPGQAYFTDLPIRAVD